MTNTNETKDYLDSVLDLIKFNPTDYDMIVDFGGQYLFTIILSHDQEFIRQYFEMLEEITKYVPYVLVLNDFNGIFHDISLTNSTNLTFINTDDVQIKLLQNKYAKYASDEQLFKNYFSKIDRIRVLFTNTPFYCSGGSDI